MATGNPVLGNIRGSIGDITTYRTGTGKQGIRVRRREIANPRTEAQQIQRMIMATAAVSLGQLSEIVSNSYEGKAFGVASQSYARQLAMYMLRASDAASADSRFNYLYKGAKVFVPNPYLLSSGTLYAPQVTAVDEEAMTFAFGAAALTADTLPSAMFAGVEVGNQITIIAVAADTASVDFAPEDGARNRVVYCRFAYKSDNLPALIAAEADTLRINPDAVDLVKVAGPWQSLRFTADGLCDVAGLAPEMSYLQAAALLVSNIERTKRSTSRMAVAVGADFPMDGGLVYPSYGESATTYNLASEVYLNNSAQVSAAAAPAADGSVTPALPAEVSGEAALSISSATMPTGLTLVVDAAPDSFTSSNIMDVEVGANIFGGQSISAILTARSYADGVLSLVIDWDELTRTITGGTLVNATGAHQLI